MKTDKRLSFDFNSERALRKRREGYIVAEELFPRSFSLAIKHSNVCKYGQILVNIDKYWQILTSAYLLKIIAIREYTKTPRSIQ